MLVGHPAVALRHLYAQMRERPSRAAQQELVFGDPEALQYRGPGERLAQLPQMRQIPRGLFGMLDRSFTAPCGETCLTASSKI